MSGRVRRGVALLAAGTLLAGCAGKRIAEGVYHSPKGYRVTLPANGWAVAEAKADLELRHAEGDAGMVTNAVCEPAVVQRSLGILTRHLLVGLIGRHVVEAGEARVNGHAAAHAVVDGRRRDGGNAVRVEAYVVKDERCVYDLVLVAAPEDFDARRPDFQRLVDSFVTE